jgi:hypothetical protein
VPIVDPPVDVVVLLDPSTGERDTVFVSTMAGSTTGSELWWEQGTAHFVLYHLDDFYDDRLRSRREAGLMISPRDLTKRLVLVGQVWGVLVLPDDRFVEIARARVNAQGAEPSVS